MVTAINISYRRRDGTAVTTHLGEKFATGCLNTVPNSYKGKTNFKQLPQNVRIKHHVRNYVRDMNGNHPTFEVI